MQKLSDGDRVWGTRNGDEENEVIKHARFAFREADAVN